MKVVCVIPTFMASGTIREVAVESAKHCDLVVVVDDKCPDSSGLLVADLDKRIHLVRRSENGGVGAATKTGIAIALEMDADVIVKLDSDGQMNPALIPDLINPILNHESEFVKGTRFDSPEDLEGMPRVRLIGNSFLSLINKYTSGYWTVNDPTNGFIAFNRRFAEEISWQKVDDGYFFESDLLFRARLISTRITQMRMRSIYRGEKSSLRPLRQVLPFTWKHFRNQFKRIIYLYFVREWNLGTIYFLTGGVSLGIAIASSVSALTQAQYGSVGTGTAVLASLGYILWVQFTTAFLTVDVSSEPK